MTTGEAEQLFEALMSSFLSSDLPDSDKRAFLDAVENEIRIGKVIQTKLKVAVDQPGFDPISGTERADKRGTGDFLARQDYSHKEKITIFLDCLAIFAVTPPLMANKIVETIQSSGVKIEKFSVVNDGSPEERDIDVNSIQDGIIVSNRLKNFIAEITKEINDYQ